MKIGLDIMGGDFAPKATVLGALEAQKDLLRIRKSFFSVIRTKP
jgi:glycerol-3-phosphate acyltransferase PlsX